jgi:hypothetical protein
MTLTMNELLTVYAFGISTGIICMITSSMMLYTLL